MNQEQVAIFSILAGILALFAWGRIRYDVVAFMGLILCVLLGLIPVQDTFSGFSHPATITVVMVLILSRGLANSGVVDLIVSRLMFTVNRVFSSCGHAFGDFCGVFHGDKQRRCVGPFDAGGY